MHHMGMRIRAKALSTSNGTSQNLIKLLHIMAAYIKKGFSHDIFFLNFLVPLI